MKYKATKIPSPATAATATSRAAARAGTDTGSPPRFVASLCGAMRYVRKFMSGCAAVHAGTYWGRSSGRRFGKATPGDANDEIVIQFDTGLRSLCGVDLGLLPLVPRLPCPGNRLPGVA